MDNGRFDTLTRKLSSRRAALGGLLGGVATLLGIAGPEAASAHTFTARCRKLKDPAKRRTCLRRTRAHARTLRCQAQPPAAVCASVRRCDGLAVDNCGRLVNCTCPVGKVCTDNGSCVRRCLSLTSCPSGCFCETDTESANTCFAAVITDCTQVPQVCGASGECPRGFRCLSTVGCSPDRNRCFSICEI